MSRPIFIHSLFLLHGLSHLCASKVNLQTNFENSGCIIAGSEISLTCTVEDTASSGATIWNGGESHEVFDCPSVNTVINNCITLEHSNHRTHVVGYCGTVSAQLIDVTNNTYTSKIYVRTTLSMDGGYVRCTDLISQTYKQVQLKIEGDV